MEHVKKHAKPKVLTWTLKEIDVGICLMSISEWRDIHVMLALCVLILFDLWMLRIVIT